MSVLLIVLAVLCVLVGIAGCILPVLPGPPLSFVALLLMRWSGAAEFDSRFLTIWGLATLAVTVLDYLLPAWLARRFGGSKQAARGSLVGLIVGMVFFSSRSAKKAMEKENEEKQTGQKAVAGGQTDGSSGRNTSQ